MVEGSSVKAFEDSFSFHSDILDVLTPSKVRLLNLKGFFRFYLLLPTLKLSTKLPYDLNIHIKHNYVDFSELQRFGILCQMLNLILKIVMKSCELNLIELLIWRLWLIYNFYGIILQITFLAFCHELSKKLAFYKLLQFNILSLVDTANTAVDTKSIFRKDF